VRVSFRRKQETIGANRVKARAPARLTGQDSQPSHATTYLYVSTPPATLEQCIALLQFASTRQPQIGSDLAAYPNVRRWLGRMKALKSWPQVYQVIDGFAASLKGKAMVSV
jgi:hypothetical protein